MFTMNTFSALICFIFPSLSKCSDLTLAKKNIFVLFCPQTGYKKIYRLLDRNSCNVEKLTNSEESFNIGTTIQYTVYCLTACAKLFTEICLVLIFVFNSTFNFFHHFFGRVKAVHNLSSSVLSQGPESFYILP